MFLKLIACEIAFREICACVARSVNLFDLEFLSQGYHANPEIGIRRIQDRIDAVEPDRFDGILVGYGLCNNMLLGLKARRTPLVIPRAHDCITFLLGSKERYQRVFAQAPGTYYYTAGWLENRQRGGERVDRKQGAGLGAQGRYKEMVEKYGADNARYLMETKRDLPKTGVGVRGDAGGSHAAPELARRALARGGFSDREARRGRPPQLRRSDHPHRTDRLKSRKRETTDSTGIRRPICAICGFFSSLFETARKPGGQKIAASLP